MVGAQRVHVSAVRREEIDEDRVVECLGEQDGRRLDRAVSAEVLGREQLRERGQDLRPLARRHPGALSGARQRQLRVRRAVAHVRPSR
jgi:hypothetical protein